MASRCTCSVEGSAVWSLLTLNANGAVDSIWWCGFHRGHMFTNFTTHDVWEGRSWTTDRIHEYLAATWTYHNDSVNVSGGLAISIRERPGFNHSSSVSWHSERRRSLGKWLIAACYLRQACIFHHVGYHRHLNDTASGGRRFFQSDLVRLEMSNTFKFGGQLITDSFPLVTFQHCVVA